MDEKDSFQPDRSTEWNRLADAIMFVVGSGETFRATDKVMEVLNAQGYEVGRYRAVGWLRGDEIHAGCPDLSVSEFETVYIREDT